MPRSRKQDTPLSADPGINLNPYYSQTDSVTETTATQSELHSCDIILGQPQLSLTLSECPATIDLINTRSLALVSATPTPKFNSSFGNK
jgi:hypothetical protein